MAESNLVLATVDDKSGLDFLGEGLLKLGWDIQAGTEGTARALIETEAGQQALEEGHIKVGYADLLVQDPIFESAATVNDREFQASMVGSMILNHAKWQESDPQIGAVCINLAYSLLGEEGEEPHYDKGGTSLLTAAISAGLIVLAKPAQYDMVLNWLRSGRPDEASVMNQLRAEAGLALSRYNTAYALRAAMAAEAALE